jgi:hypothetical protein
MLLELASEIKKYQNERKRLDPNFEEVPYLFVFFDLKETGVIGCIKTLIE